MKAKEALKFAKELAEQSQVETMRASMDPKAGKNRYSKSEELSKQYLAIIVAQKGWKKEETASALVSLAIQFDANEKWSDSVWCRRRAIEIYKSLSGENSFDCRSAMYDLTGPLHKLGQHEEELSIQRKVVQLAKQDDGPFDYYYVWSMKCLADLYKRDEMFSDQESTLLSCIEISRAAKFSNTDTLIDCFDDLQDLYKRQKSRIKIDELLKQRKDVLAEFEKRKRAEEARELAKQNAKESRVGTQKGQKDSDKSLSEQKQTARDKEEFDKKQAELANAVYAEARKTFSEYFNSLIDVAEKQFADKEMSLYWREKLKEVGENKLVDTMQLQFAMRSASEKLTAAKKVRELIAIKQLYAGILRKLLGEKSTVWFFENEVADLQESEGLFADAERTFRALIDRLKNSKESDAIEMTSKTRQRLAKLFELEGGGIDEGADAISMLESAAGASDNKDKPYEELGRRYLAQNQPKKAEAAYRSAIEVLEKSVAEKYMDIQRINLALSYRSLGDSFKKQNRFDEAEVEYKRSISIFEDISDPQHRDDTSRHISQSIVGAYKSTSLLLLKLHKPTAYLRVADNSLAKGDTTLAQIQYEKALQMGHEAFGNGTGAYPFYQGLARCFSAQGKLIEAEHFFRLSRALSLESSTFAFRRDLDRSWSYTRTMSRGLAGSDFSDTAISASSKIKTLVETLESKTRSKTQLYSALAELKRLIDKDSASLSRSKLADILEYAAVTSEELRPDIETLPLWFRALELRKLESGPKSFSVAHTLTSISLVVTKYGGTSDDLSAQARQIFERGAQDHDGHSDEARFSNLYTLLALSNVLFAQGDEDGAIKVASIALNKTISQQSTISRASDLKLLGDYFLEHLNPGQAKSCYEAALNETSIANSPSKGIEIRLAMCRSDIASGDLRPSEKRLLDLLRETENDKSNRKNLISTCQLLSSVYSEQGRFDAAEKYATRALSIAEQSKDETILCSLNLANIYKSRKKFDDARKLYFKVLQESKKQQTGNGESDLTASIYRALGDLYLNERKIPEARQYLLRTLALSKAKNSVLDVISSELIIAKLHLVENEPELAQSYAMSAARRANDYAAIVLPNLAFREQCSFSAFLNRQIGTLLSCVKDTKGAVDAYGYLMSWKGLLVESLRRQNHILQLAKSQNSDTEFQELARLRQKMVLATSAFGTSNSANLERFSFQKAALERNLSRKYSLDAFKDPMTDMNSQGFSKLLTNHEAFIDVFYYTPSLESVPQYAAVIVTASDTRFIKLGNADAIDSRCKEWLQALSGTTEGSAAQRGIAKDEEETVSTKSETDLRAAVSELLLKQIEPYLSESAVTKIWICPERQLAKIPWNLLVLMEQSDGSIPEKPESHAVATSLDNIQISEIDSAREFVILRKKKSAPSIQPTKMFLAGNIDFTNSKFDPLDGTKIEINSILKLAKDRDFPCSALEQGNATRSAVLKGIEKAQFVHLATHGFFQVPQPSGGLTTASDGAAGTSEIVDLTPDPLLYSGLIVASDSSHGKNQSRYSEITAEDLLAAKLDNCDLVTLSACQTGSGTEVSGQGLLGLRSAIIAGGAGSLLISLWRVDDLSTAALMEEFYAQLWSGKCNDKAIALRRAQEKVQLKWTHSRYWAPWVLIGN